MCVACLLSCLVNSLLIVWCRAVLSILFYPNILSYPTPCVVQSLVRRAQASEACERYKSALQDVRQVLAYGEATCGKATYELANGMQHRLNRVIAQLKS